MLYSPSVEGTRTGTATAYGARCFHAALHLNRPDACDEQIALD